MSENNDFPVIRIISCWACLVIGVATAIGIYVTNGSYDGPVTILPSILRLAAPILSTSLIVDPNPDVKLNGWAIMLISALTLIAGIAGILLEIIL